MARATNSQFFVNTPLQLRSYTPKQSELLNSVPGSVNNTIGYLLNAYQRLPVYHRAIFALQVLYGLRASEALGIQDRDLSGFGLVRIRGKKTSNPRVIYAPWLDSYGNPHSGTPTRNLFHISYRAYYSQLKKAGCDIAPSGLRKYRIVTHAARNILFQELSTLWKLAPQELMQFTGHKSLSGLMYYLQQGKLSGITEPTLTNPQGEEDGKDS